MIRRYSEMIQFNSFEDRFNYLQLHGSVANETFGFDRYLNQRFYKSSEWKHIRDFIIVRDNACDLACPDLEIPKGKIIIHHMNPLSLDDLKNNPELLLDPEFLVCVSLETHNAIHYGDKSLLNKHQYTERLPNDTTLWRK